MEHQTSQYAPTPASVLDFLRKTMPFNELEPELLRAFARQCVIGFFPKDTLISQQDVSEIDYFYLIQKGAVRLYLKDDYGDITLKDFRSEGEYFGALPIIHGTRANLNVETVEDTFCFLFPREDFLHLVHNVPTVTQFYLRSMSEKLVRTAYAELRQHKVTPKTESALYLFTVPVGNIVKGEPQCIADSDSVRQAAGLMSALQIGSLLVKESSGTVLGIITDKDLRTKVVAEGLPYYTPVRTVMSAPVQTVPAHVVCFDALLTMMTRNIHHLAVESQGEITGILTTHDIMVLQGTSPLYLFREILAQRKIEGLYSLAAKIPQVVRTLVEEGAKANNIARMITVLNDHVLERLITLLVKELGPPPLPFCWMLLGSEGRKEQTFKTDQDNALIFQEPENEEQAAAANSYFTSLGERAIAHLQGCGFPPCPGDIMASNPRWRMPVSGWQHSFEDWIYRPDPQEIRNATIFFDFRAGPGEATLVDRLRAHLSPLARDQEIFLRYLAKDCLESRPPISFLRNFLVEKDGEHRNLLDLKKRGLVPFVDFARVMALRCGIQASNTVDRFRLLQDGNHIPAALGTEAMEAYEFIMHLRLLHQMHLLEGGEMPDNFINPGDLTDLEKKTLKEAFGVVRSLQSFLRQEFRIEQG